MDNWIETALRLPRIEDADENDNVFADDGNGPYLTQWFNVDRDYHRCWSKTNAPPDATLPKLRLQTQHQN